MAPDEIDQLARQLRTTREGAIAYLQRRSESLRDSHTTTGPGTSAAPQRPRPALQTQQPRPGILGYMADRVAGVLSGVK